MHAVYNILQGVINAIRLQADFSQLVSYKVGACLVAVPHSRMKVLPFV